MTEQQYHQAAARVELRTRRRRKAFAVSIPPSDIDACVRFSWPRCVFSLVGLLLVSSDVPRASFGARGLLGAFDRVAPNARAIFGPFAYSVAQLHRRRSSANNASDAIDGSCDGERLAAVDVWAYKFDSLSIPLRGVAQMLRVDEYPQCLQYVDECPSNQLSLEPTFRLLDGLAAALDRRQRSSVDASEPLVFQTRSYWVDRLNHVLLAMLGYRHVDTRFHAAHFYSRAERNARSNSSSRVGLCSAALRRQSHQPFFCDYVVVFAPLDDEGVGDSDDITMSARKRRIRISDHIARRFAALERAHLDLHFDLAVFTTLLSTASTTPLPNIPIVYHRSDVFEVTTVMRGRQCDHNSTSGAESCETMLVDDYRYEREVLETNMDDWFQIPEVLRVLAQLYVWIRLACLWIGCYMARSCEPKFVGASLLRRMLWTWRTVFRIPSHVIIYGSWIPIGMYSLAHYMDSGIVHKVSENTLTSLKGIVQLDFLAYVSFASIQMRNIWYVALAVKCLAAAHLYLIPHRSSPWTRRDGLVGLRGEAIGFVSWLTIFAYLRFVHFRNSKILSTKQAPPHSACSFRHFSPSFVQASEFGLPFDARVIYVVGIGALCVAGIMKTYLVCGNSNVHRRLQRYFVMDADNITRVLVSRQYFIPYSAGTIASLSALCLFWKVKMLRPHSARASLFSRRTHVIPSPSVLATELVLHQSPSRSRNKTEDESIRKPSGERHRFPRRKPQPETLLHVGRRTKELWSVVKLMNIALLTEPLALFCLYVAGRDLYIYRYVSVRVHARASGDPTAQSQLFLLPCDEETLATNTAGVYQLVGTVDSRSVPWRLLVLCG